MLFTNIRRLSVLLASACLYNLSVDSPSDSISASSPPAVPLRVIDVDVSDNDFAFHCEFQNETYVVCDCHYLYPKPDLFSDSDIVESFSGRPQVIPPLHFRRSPRHRRSRSPRCRPRYAHAMRQNSGVVGATVVAEFLKAFLYKGAFASQAKLGLGEDFDRLDRLLSSTIYSTRRKPAFSDADGVDWWLSQATSKAQGFSRSPRARVGFVGAWTALVRGLGPHRRSRDPSRRIQSDLGRQFWSLSCLRLFFNPTPPLPFSPTSPHSFKFATTHLLSVHRGRSGIAVPFESTLLTSTKQRSKTWTSRADASRSRKCLAVFISIWSGFGLCGPSLSPSLTFFLLLVLPFYIYPLPFLFLPFVPLHIPFTYFPSSRFSTFLPICPISIYPVFSSLCFYRLGKIYAA
ncbi:hypothetical protein B0H19DRAFT_699040 [Mycena capillaripes]|nr:hypothetical protein B0H19DRAFT_699040 [Mycena capillaripes]